MALNQFFERISTPYAAILALLILVGSTYVLSRINPAEGIKEAKLPFLALGTSFGYRSKELYEMLNGFNSPEGQPFKEKYRRFLYLDLIYPWFYGLSAAVLLAFYQRSVASAEMSV